MYSNVPIRYRDNKRKGKDLILRLIDIACIVLWVILLINLGIILCARPEEPNFFDKLFHVKVRDYWDFGTLLTAFAVSIGEFILSIVGLYLNSRRMKRKYDRIRVSIIISLVASILMGIFLGLYLFS